MFNVLLVSFIILLIVCVIAMRFFAPFVVALMELFKLIGKGFSSLGNVLGTIFLVVVIILLLIGLFS